MDHETINEIIQRGVSKHSIQVLLSHGRRKGFLTPGDIIDCIPDTQWDEELLTKLHQVITDAGIPFIELDEEEVDGPGDNLEEVVEEEEDLQVALPLVEQDETSEDEEEEADEDEPQERTTIITKSVREDEDEEDVKILDLENLGDEDEETTFENIATDDMVGLYMKEAARVPLLTADEEVELAKRIERGQKAQQEMARGRINAERRDELNRQIEAGRNAREHLIRANARLVISVAKKYMNRGLPFLDLIQEGNIGLMRAIRHFDYKRGFKFSTYATWWIRQAVTRSLAEQSRTIRLPVHMSDAVNRMLREQSRLQQELGRKPNVSELSEALEVSPDRVEQMQKIVRQPLSLQTPIGEEDDDVLGDFIEDVSSPDPEESASQVLANEDLMRRLETLPPREYQVLQLRYGLGGAEPMTLNQIGQEMGITRERARQLEAQALQRLRGQEAQEKENGGRSRRTRRQKSLDEDDRRDE